jgi:hypothetical protein
MKLDTPMRELYGTPEYFSTEEIAMMRELIFGMLV